MTYELFLWAFSDHVLSGFDKSMHNSTVSHHIYNVQQMMFLHVLTNYKVCMHSKAPKTNLNICEWYKFNLFAERGWNWQNVVVISTVLYKARSDKRW
jgi:hypothetical protein